MTILEANDLKKNFAHDDEMTKVLKGVSLAVEQGDFISIMGKSGGGKTTLLKVLGLIDQQSSGEVRFRGESTVDLTADQLADIRRCSLGFIFQDYYLMEHLTAQENIMLPMIIGKEKSAYMTERARKLAGEFGIEYLLSQDTGHLSGGEKQRVAICRALVNQPDILLGDEPTGNLDTKSSQTVIDSLVKANRELGTTVLLVTHDPQIASYSNRVLFLVDGRIQEEVCRRDGQESFYQQILGQMKAE